MNFQCAYYSRNIGALRSFNFFIIIITFIFIPPVVKIPWVKSKVKHRSAEWLHVRVVYGSQNAVAEKNFVESLYYHYFYTTVVKIHYVAIIFSVCECVCCWLC